MKIRKELPGDHAQVFEVNAAAFPTDAEARLVESLREIDGYIGLVAVEDDRVVGHIAFSPVTLNGIPISFAGLAPMAVLPERQRAGVGSGLIGAGIAECRSAGYNAIFVLGHPEYYPRFGFVQASGLGYTCEYEVPPEAFMCMELSPAALSTGGGGVVGYSSPFAEL